MTTEVNLDTTKQTLAEKLEHLRNSLRPGQKSLADWQGGQMAISAVPGAGKSHSLSVACAIAIARNQLHLGKQLVIVTYTRSAAAGIKAKIRENLKQLSLPQTGFVVHTLHGLALHIASRHPELSGLNLDTATLIIPSPNHRIVRTAVEHWIAQKSDKYLKLLEGLEFDGEETEQIRRQSVLRTEVLPNLAHTVIHSAKSSGLTPEAVEELSHKTNDHYQVLAIAAELYQEYEKLMRSQNFIDYDDMILAALRVLNNPTILPMWQKQIFAVFEDEAQDSSPLQEKLITLLAADANNPDAPSNLVRVGDPNQAINSTFTPADPIYFNWFCQTCSSKGFLETMDQAGRSSKIIIDAANFMLESINQKWHKKRYLIEPPFRFQQIQTVETSDPQPDANPAHEGKGLEIYTPSDIYQTVELIGKRVVKLLTENPQRNAAILVRENRQGSFLASELSYLPREHKIKVYEVGEVERHSHIPEEILKLLQFMSRPHSPDYLKAALEVLESRSLIPTQDLNALVTSVEQFLYPSPLAASQKPQVKDARRYCCNLLQAKIELPTYQLIPFLGMALKYTGSELATSEKLSERVNKQIQGNSSIKNIIAVLEEIVNSEQFEQVEEETDNRYTKPGQLTIITMHKAKGLDWDYVFIPFLHEDILPGQLRVPVAAEFLGKFTLSEVARAQIRAASRSQYQQLPYKIPSPVQAWKEAEQLKEAEEYRLLYVAMTRAKRLLWMSAEKKGPFRWNLFSSNSGGNLQNKTACPVLTALISRFPQSLVK